jgi:hypothetical protein
MFNVYTSAKKRGGQEKEQWTKFAAHAVLATAEHSEYRSGTLRALVSTPRVPLEYSEYLGREGLLDAHEVRQLRHGRQRGRLQPFSRLGPFPLNGEIPT